MNLGTELIRKCCLDYAAIFFVTDVVRKTLQTDTERSNPLTTKIKVIITL